MSAVTEKYGVPMLAPNAASEQVYDQGFKYLFGVYTPNQTLTEPIAALLNALALDDDDVLREARLLRLLHAGTGFEGGVTPADVLDAACRQGAAAAGCPDAGEIAAGRAAAANVHTLVIAGRPVVVAGKVTGVDEQALQAALSDELAAHAAAMERFAPVLHRYQQGLARFYGRGGHC